MQNQKIKNKMRCGITGSGGVLGRRLIKFKQFKFIRFNGDVTQKKQVDSWIKNNQFDIFLHLAAIVPTEEVESNYKYAKKVNYNGTSNIFNSLIKHQNNNLKWFFFPSTSHVYKFSKNKITEKFKLKPISKYGKTKLFAENFINKKLKKANFKCCIGRIFSFTDKNQKVPFLIPSLKNKLSSNKKEIILKNLNHYRDFISILDLCRAIIFLSKKKYSGIINLASGKKLYLKNAAKKLNQLKKNITFVDNKHLTNLVGNISRLKKIGFKFVHGSLDFI